MALARAPIRKRIQDWSQAGTEPGHPVDTAGLRRRTISAFNEASGFQRAEPIRQYVRADLRDRRPEIREPVLARIEADKDTQYPAPLDPFEWIRPAIRSLPPFRTTRIAHAAAAISGDPLWSPGLIRYQRV